MLKRRVVRNPKKEAMTFGLILLAVIAIFFAVLNFVTAKRFHSSAEVVAGPLRFNLQMPKTNYAEGEDIPIKLTVSNISNSDVVLRFDEDLEYDFMVKRDVNLIFATVPFDVWKYSASHPGGKKPHQRTLKPGQSITYEGVWPQVNAENEKVGAGRYVITGMINLAGKEKTTLEIRGGTQ
jgi:hypothetical protein